MASISKPHIVIFPFTAQGHTIPLLDLSKELSRRGLKVTIITTPSNASSTIKPYLSQHPNIILKQILFPEIKGLPKGCENMSQLLSHEHLLPFLNATKLLQKPFETMFTEISSNDPPACLISDSFLGWTNAICRTLGIPRIAFNGMSVFAMTIKKAVEDEETRQFFGRNGDEVVNVKGVEISFELTVADLPKSMKEENNPNGEFFLEAVRSDSGSWAIIANSFMALEKDYVVSLESLYDNKTKTFCVGPLFLYDQLEGEKIGLGPKLSSPWAEWLNENREDKSVIYVSFGSVANLSDEQLEELAYGLELSGENYIWVVRYKTWSPPTALIGGGEKKGIVVNEWVDQKWVLAHWAVGEFLGHCGWNSVLESLANGVPILAWPMMAEQHLNAKYLVEGLKVGIRLPSDGNNVVLREEIGKGVKELMSGIRGRQARDKAIEFGKMAKEAVLVGGSSYKSLNELIERFEEGVYS
ncbi:hypothetical protein UlMin_003719 [Ulmus minor]